VRDRSLGILFLTTFVLTWAGQLVVEWLEFVHEQSAHLAGSVLGDLRAVDAREPAVGVLQLSAFAIACAYLVYKARSESPDGEQRLEAKLDALLEKYGVDPAEFEMTSR
jgi:hypothetical protein